MKKAIYVILAFFVLTVFSSCDAIEIPTCGYYLGTWDYKDARYATVEIQGQLFDVEIPDNLVSWLKTHETRDLVTVIFCIDENDKVIDVKMAE